MKLAIVHINQYQTFAGTTLIDFLINIIITPHKISHNLFTLWSDNIQAPGFTAFTLPNIHIRGNSSIIKFNRQVFTQVTKVTKNIIVTIADIARTEREFNERGNIIKQVLIAVVVSKHDMIQLRGVNTKVLSSSCSCSTKKGEAKRKLTFNVYKWVVCYLLLLIHGCLNYGKRDKQAKMWLHHSKLNTLVTQQNRQFPTSKRKGTFVKVAKTALKQAIFPLNSLKRPISRQYSTNWTNHTIANQLITA